MTWRRFIILICSIAVIAGSVKLVEACAGGDPEPTEEPTFFFNIVNNQPVYTPLYYTPYRTFYTDGYSFDSGQFGYRIPDENIVSWRKYTANAVSEADLDSFLYKYSAKDVMNIYESIRKDYTLSVPVKVSQNTFTRWLVTHKDHEAALYIAFAKQCEPYALPIERYWDDAKNDMVSAKRDSAAMQELVHEGIKRYTSASQPDLKLRYAYQAMRMAFYSGEYPQTLMIFNTMMPPGSNHYIYYRSLSLKAGALYRTGKKREAAYYYSHVFDSSDEQKVQACQSFRWAVNGKSEQVLPLCRSDHERAVLYIMSGMYDYDVSALFGAGGPVPGNTSKLIANISAAYRYDPKVKGLDVLMTRYINQLEAPLIPQMTAAKHKTDVALNELNAFAQHVATENKAGNKSYWLLASAYLYMLDGDAANCKKQLDNAKAAGMSPREEDVHYVINTLYIIRKKGKITTETENELLPVMRVLEQKAKTATRYSVLFKTIMQTILQPAYLQQNDTSRAIYAYSRACPGPRYGYSYAYSLLIGQESNSGELLESMSPGQIRRVEDFILRKNKTPFEVWLTENTVFSESMLYELEGTKHIRMMQFDKAAEALKKVEAPDLNSTVLPDVFVSHLSDNRQWNKSDSGTFYNKLTFAMRMSELQQKLAQDPADSRAAYQYANGLYSMSYYGKASMAFAYYRSSADYKGYYISKERKKLSATDKEYYTVASAEHYYMQAYTNSTDPELKARCIFLAAKCWQKNCPVKKEEEYFSGDEHAYYLNSLRNPYFRQLKEDFDHTIFYKKAKGTCAYLQDYVDTHK